MDIHRKEANELKRRLNQMKPVAKVGKGGVTVAAGELKRQLKEKKLIKVKILRSALNDEKSKKAIAKEIADATGAKIIEIKGNNIGLLKGKKP